MLTCVCDRRTRKNQILRHAAEGAEPQKASSDH
jgi:hypothetical protein